MKKMKQLLLGTITFLLLLGLNVNKLQAQTDTLKKIDYNHFYATFGGGLLQFYGDISSDIYFPGSGMKGKINPYGSFKLGYNFNQYFGAQGSFLVGSLWSEDNQSFDYFHLNTNDYLAEGVVNITSLLAPKKYNKKWEVTLNIGAGFMQYRTILQNQNDSMLSSLGYENENTKSKMEWDRLWSIGSSVHYRLSKHWDLGFDLGLRKPPTDKLDGKYQGLLVFSEFDRYGNTGLSLTYTFGKKTDSWQWNPWDPEIKALHEKIIKNQATNDSLEDKLNAISSERIAKEDCECFEKGYQIILNQILDSLRKSMNNQIVYNNNQNTNVFPVQPSHPGSYNNPMHFSSVYFPYDQTTIDEVNYQKIIQVAIYMKKYPNSNFIISGNCDIRGTDDYNADLSQRRSEKVIDILVTDFGIDKNRLKIEALGKLQPISVNNHDLNRRVDFFIP